MKYLFALVLVVMASLVYCQDKSKISIGITLGPNFSYVMGPADVTNTVYSANKGYLVSLGAQYKLFNFIGIRAAIENERKGSFLTIKDYSGNSAEVEHELNYLQIAGSIFLTTQRKVGIQGHIGPFFGLLLNQKTNTSNVDNLQESYESQTVNTNIDYGLVFSPGLFCQVSRRVRLSVDFRWTVGVKNLDLDRTYSFIGNDFYDNSSVSILGSAYVSL